MGKASSSKKVARAASTGGGRTSRGARPWGWYLTMGMVAVMGTLAIVSSRNERQASSNPLKSEKPRPPASDKGFAGDHWHAAYGLYICDSFLGPIESDRDPQGIHTHNDGVIHIHPFTRAVSGRKATFGVFTRAVGITITEDKLEVPGDKTYNNGDKCGKKTGKVQVFLNGEERAGDPRKIRLRDRDLLVIAFAPEGAEFPKKPPSEGNLDNLNDVPGSPGLTVPSSVPVPGTEGAPVEGAPTPAPGDETAPPTTTAAPAATDSTSPPTSSP